MTRSKRLNTILLIVCIGGVLYVVVGIIYSLYLWIELPPPTITRGEFPFRLEYEIQGERHVIEDTVIAEFSESVSGNINRNASRIWNTSLESGEIRFFRIKDDENVRITFQHGLATYFMGDLRNTREFFPLSAPINSMPRIIIQTDSGQNREEVILRTFEEAYEVLSQHGITLISWEYAEPIVNSFEW